MTDRRDIVVTVPKGQWQSWLEEGDLPEQAEFPCFMCVAEHVRDPNVPCSLCLGRGVVTAGTTEWAFHLGGHAPPLKEGARCYVVAHGRLRGYSPVVRIETIIGTEMSGVRRRLGFSIVRRGGAVACTTPEPIKGFRGWRWRWWDRTTELPFPAWQTEGVR